MTTTDRAMMTAALAASLRQEFSGLLARPARVGELVEAGELTPMQERNGAAPPAVAQPPAAGGAEPPAGQPVVTVAAVAQKPARTRQAAPRATSRRPVGVRQSADESGQQGWF